MHAIKYKLKKRTQSSLFRGRKIAANDGAINFSDNDYLDISRDKRLIQAALTASQHYGISNNASPLVCGYTKEHQKLEQQFADFLQRDRALLFTNGYIANTSILTTLPHRHDIILQDQYCHASLIEGARLSEAKCHRYQHNQPLHLQHYLNQYKDKHCFIASDSVFSTTGCIANIKSIASIAQQYQTTLYVDDAHGIGILGKHGGGVCEYMGLTQTQLPIVVCPLGKALGCYGAIVAGSDELIESLIQFAKPYIYSTAIPASLAAAARSSLNIIKKEHWRRQKLLALSDWFQYTSKTLGLGFIDTPTPIKALIIKNVNEAIALQQQLLNNHFLTTLLRPPSSGENYSLLRISLSCRHNKQQISALLQTVRKYYEQT